MGLEEDEEDEFEVRPPHHGRRGARCANCECSHVLASMFVMCPAKNGRAHFMMQRGAKVRGPRQQDREEAPDVSLL